MNAVMLRRSVRKFNQEKTIDYKLLVELCKAGEAAPSARNQKGREYIIIDDKETIKKLSLVSKGALVMENCQAAIAVIGNDPEKMISANMQTQDLSCSVENVLIEATRMGIGSCYIVIYPIDERVEKSNEVLGIKDNKFTFALIALGYPQDENAFYEKEDFDEKLIHHNRY